MYSGNSVRTQTDNTVYISSHNRPEIGDRWKELSNDATKSAVKTGSSPRRANKHAYELWRWHTAALC